MKNSLLTTAKHKFKDNIDEVTFFTCVIRNFEFYAGIIKERTDEFYILLDGKKLEKNKYVIINKTIQL